MNQTLQVISKRYSCRSYSAEMPSEEQINALAEAALAAPSAFNAQPWEIVILKNKELIAELDESIYEYFSKLEDQSAYERFKERGGKVLYEAPCIFLIPIKKGAFTQVDCGIAAENIALAAESLGLGSCINGTVQVAFATEKSKYFKQRLAFPEDTTLGIAVLVGYPKNPTKPHEIDKNKIRFIE